MNRKEFNPPRKYSFIAAMEPQQGRKLARDFSKFFRIHIRQWNIYTPIHHRRHTQIPGSSYYPSKKCRLSRVLRDENFQWLYYATLVTNTNFFLSLHFFLKLRSTKEISQDKNKKKKKSIVHHYNTLYYIVDDKVIQIYKEGKRVSWHSQD